MKLKKLIPALSLIFLLPAIGAFAKTMGDKLQGRILLQVEAHGEAWYINPSTQERHFMGRPGDAFSLMRELGVGITNANLEKIQIADSNLDGADNDQDGLSDILEDALGTDKNSKDTDNDEINDKQELLNGVDPAKKTKYAFDKNFAAKQQGKILLQVEAHGEAWYVNPTDNKRYFLGRPGDAFNLMRKLGLGIKNADLEKINQVQNRVQNRNTNNQPNTGDEANNPNSMPKYPDYLQDYTDYLKLLLGDNATSTNPIGNDNTNTTQNNSGENNNSNLDEDMPSNEPADIDNTPQTTPTYKTSDKLSTITFSRDITGPYNDNYTGGARNQNVTMKITGYMKEIAPNSNTLTQYSDKAYELSQGQVEWNIKEYLNDGDTIKCTYIYETQGAGKDDISNLDVNYDVNEGKDDQGNIFHLDGYDLKIGYKQNDFLYNTSKLEILGSLLIPIEETDSIIHNKSNLICNNTTETTVGTFKEIAIVKFPLVLLGINPQGNLNGSLTAYESVTPKDKTNIISETANAAYGFLTFNGKVDVDEEKTPWNVTWDLKFPE